MTQPGRKGNRGRPAADDGGPKRTEAVKLADFQRLAGPRVDKALGAIARVGKLATPRYAWTPAQAEAIVRQLTNAVVGVRDRLAGAKQSGPKADLPQIELTPEQQAEVNAYTAAIEAKRAKAGAE